jgi:hypothetical protein
MITYTDTVEHGTLYHSATITGTSLDRVIAETLLHIRPQSRAFYEHSLREDYNSGRKMFVDHHPCRGIYLEPIVKP